MPITIQSNKLKVKNGNSYIGINGISDNTIAEYQAQIAAEASTQMDNIDAKGAEVIASIDPGYDDVVDAIATVFSSSTPYSAGDYVWYDSTLYRFAVDHAAGSWIGTDARLVRTMSEVAKNTADIGELKSAVDDCFVTYVAYDQAEFTDPGYCEPDGTPHADSGGNWYKTNSIPLDNVDKIIVKLYQNTSLVAPVCFYSAPGVLLSAVTTIDPNAGNGVARGEIAIPTGAKYVRFGLRAADSGQYAHLYYDSSTWQDVLVRFADSDIVDGKGNSETDLISQAGVTKLDAENAKINVKIDDFPNLGYIKSTGPIQSDSSGNWGYTDLIPLPYGLKSITVKLYCNPSVNAMVAFYNNVGTRIQAVATVDGATSGAVYTGDIAVPGNAFYVRATKRTADGEQYVSYPLNYNEVMMDSEAVKSYVFADILAKPFVLSGANAIGIGDSIMYGYRSLDTTDVSSNPWPNIVKDRFEFNNFTNYAVGGAGFTVGTTLLQQITGKTLNTRDYIFVAAGTNDYHYAAPIGSFADAVDGVFDYIDANKGTQTKVIVITPINRSQAPGTANSASLDVYRTVLTQKALARGYSVIDGRKFGFPTEAGTYQEAILPDGLHPNDAGYIMYANHICGLIG